MLAVGKRTNTFARLHFDNKDYELVKLKFINKKDTMPDIVEVDNVDYYLGECLHNTNQGPMRLLYRKVVAKDSKGNVIRQVMPPKSFSGLSVKGGSRIFTEPVFLGVF